VRIDSRRSDGLPSEKHVIVDATTSTILDVWDDIHTAQASAAPAGNLGTGKSLFSGVVPLQTTATQSGYELRDTARGGHVTVDMGQQTAGSGKVFKDPDNAWGSGSVSNRATVAVDAHYGAAMTWDYFKNVHGRLGIANDGRGASSRVHFDNGFNNAFWSDACFCMTYGDGDGVTLHPLVALDVAGHEMTHGITSRTARLIYSGESGGLNEATSDIFGTAVEFYAKNTKDPGDYVIGEKLFKNAGRIIRSMVQPSVDGASADCYYAGVGSLDVHKSSGVANHFFFLLAEGTTQGQPSPTCTANNVRVATGTGTLTGVGRTAAEKIWYRALTRYMTSNTNFALARQATLRAAADLFGAGSAQVHAVEMAWGAVNVH
jgi:Zn-dependent metalloprotease